MSKDYASKLLTIVECKSSSAILNFLKKKERKKKAADQPKSHWHLTTARANCSSSNTTEARNKHCGIWKQDQFKQQNLLRFLRIDRNCSEYITLLAKKLPRNLWKTL